MARQHARNKYIRGTSNRIPPGKNTVSLSLDLSSVDKLLSDLVGAVEDGVRPAAQKAAQVFYARAVANVNSMGHAPLKVAALGSVTGNLKGSIYQVYSKANSVDGEKATYHISWNARKAPHGHLVEYGHIMRYRTFVATKGPKKGQWVTDVKHPLNNPHQVAAHPFMRPAFWDGQEAAKEAMAQELMRRVKESTNES